MAPPRSMKPKKKEGRDKILRALNIVSIQCVKLDTTTPPVGLNGGSYCAVRKIGDSPSRTAQSGGESEEGWRPAPLGRVPATQAWVRGEG